MTHEQIEAAIERLEKLGSNGFIFDTDIVDAVNDSTDMFEVRNTIIDLLQQADPDTHMKLPKGADGEYIHIGDELCGYGHPKGGVYCQAIINGWGVAVGTVPITTDPSGWRLWNVSDIRHYHKPTVEDVLREFGNEVQRCCDTEDTIAEYAAKLREVMADDDTR